MARRRKSDSLLEDALKGRWPVAAIIAGGAFVFGYLLMPVMLSGSPITAPFLHMMRTLMGVVALIFGVIAVVKFILERRKQGQTPYLQPVPSTPLPTVRSSEPTKVDQAWDSSIREASPKPAIDTSTWSMELLQAIEWKRYEDLCAAFYREKGIRSETTPLGADGGVDVRLYQDENNPQATGIVQCKAWGERQVGVKPVRELLGVMTHEKIPKAFFMAPGGFTEDAREFAKANGITLLDGKLFLSMLERLPLEASKKLLAFATEGDFTTPSCPSCGIKMVNRSGPRGEFWGCSHYPKCKQTMPMRKAAQ
jgi:restriction system protein